MSKVASKERIGREPLRQLPVKCSSSIVCTAGKRPSASKIVDVEGEEERMERGGVGF